MIFMCILLLLLFGEEVEAMNERTKGDVGGGDEV